MPHGLQQCVHCAALAVVEIVAIIPVFCTSTGRDRSNV